MNAIEIIDNVRAHNAELVVEQGQLLVRGHGDRLPADLQATLRKHKPVLLVALGAPHEVGVLEVLSEIRPYLPAALKDVPDASMLALVNWSILNAWNRAVSEFGSSGNAPRCIKCGVVMSVVRVSDVCGRCAA